MNIIGTLRGIVAAAAIACVAMPALAQDNEGLITSDDVRTEISEALEAIANYSEQERRAKWRRSRWALLITGFSRTR